MKKEQMKELLEILIKADKAEEKLNAHLSRLYHDTECPEPFSKNSLLGQALCSFEVMDVLFMDDKEVDQGEDKSWELIWNDMNMPDDEKVVKLLKIWEKIS